MKKIFVASLATEVNTFSPIFTNMESFKESFYVGPGEHPDTPTLCSAPFIAARDLVVKEGWQLIEGSASWADPAGIVARQTYEFLRDEILEQLKSAMPVDGVFLGLHGAMVAQGYLDCEGDFLSRVRDIVGENCFIGAELDPHSHLTPLRVEKADCLISFKEFPHIDFLDRAYELVQIGIDAIKGNVKPVMSMFDCRMIEVLPTTREPMLSFVKKMKDIETQKHVLSVSTIHGFMAGDVPEMGTKTLVVTDANQELGEKIAKDLGEELFSFRGTTRPPFLTIEQALTDIQALLTAGKKCITATDVWDNPGGGVAGDATILLRAVWQEGMTNVAFAPMWDPMAVRMCMAAGIGAKIPLRFGGKSDRLGGDPIDADVTVKNIVKGATQRFAQSIVPMGDSVLIEFDGVEVILNSNRAQAFEPDLFTNMGVDVKNKDVLFVKSTNHFHSGFAKISEEIIYIDVGAPYPSNPKATKYEHLVRPIWPIVDNPFDC